MNEHRFDRIGACEDERARVGVYGRVKGLMAVCMVLIDLAL